MLIQKRKLFPDLPTASSGPLGSPRRVSCESPTEITVPLPGSGIGTGFPIARRSQAHTRWRTFATHQHRLSPRA